MKLKHINFLSGKVAMHYAVEGRKFDIVEYILSKKKLSNYNPQDINGISPCHLAAGYGYDEIVNLFLQHKDVVSNLEPANGFTPMHSASKNGHENVVQLFLESDKIL